MRVWLRHHISVIPTLYTHTHRYGYIFAAAEIGLSHQIIDDVMLYAGAQPDIALPPPKILHYGLWCQVAAPNLHAKWSFNKLSYTGGHAGGFNPHECDHYFPAPPLPTDLVRAQLDRADLGAALLCAEVGVRLNAALCEYHHLAPPPSSADADDDPSDAPAPIADPPCVAIGRTREEAICPAPTVAQMLEAESASDAIGTPSSCDDGDPRCVDWAGLGECDGPNSAVVRPLCPASCQEARCSHDVSLTLGGNTPTGREGGGDAAGADQGEQAPRQLTDERLLGGEHAAGGDAAGGDGGGDAGGGEGTSPAPSPPPAAPPSPIQSRHGQLVVSRRTMATAMREERSNAEANADEEVAAALADDLIVLNPSTDEGGSMMNKGGGTASHPENATTHPETATTHPDTTGTGNPKRDGTRGRAATGKEPAAHGPLTAGADHADVVVDTDSPSPSSPPSPPPALAHAPAVAPPLPIGGAEAATSDATEEDEEARADLMAAKAEAAAGHVSVHADAVGGYDLVDLVLAVAGVGLLLAATCLLRGVQHRVRGWCFGKSRVN